MIMVIRLLVYIYFNYGGIVLLILQHTLFLCLMNCIKSSMLHFHTTPKSHGFFAFFQICSIF